jgi:hypothetical protein
MNIQKATWLNGDRKMSLAFPFAKVDKANRTVSGFATLDNVDKHGDIVTSDASKAAFERFRGNIREMHQPIAVGKVLSFNEEDYYDANEGKNYKGVFVQAYISKGAQDTWEKVLDGTLTGFSIGGNIVTASMEKSDNETDEERRVIKEYDLHELSLVDNPANPLANVFSIQKSGDNLIFKGMATEIEAENVFWCGTDQIATAYSGETKDCSICGDSMDTIGWVEKNDTEKNSAIQKVVDGYLQKDDAPGPDHGPNNVASESASSPINSQDTINRYPDQNNISTTRQGVMDDTRKKISKGGSIVTEENTEIQEAEEINEVVEESDDAAIEKAADISELEVDELDFTKMVTDLKDFVGEKLEKSADSAKDSTKEFKKALKAETSDLIKKFDELAAEKEELAKSVDALNNLVTELQKSLTETNERVNSYENDTAIKKSGEVDSPAMVTKDDDFWQGSFLGVNAL